MFYIKLAGKGRNAVFSLKISLHTDDTPTLEFIKNTLGIGEVYRYKRSDFIVTNQKELKVLIKIFSEYSLNSTKLLNFLDFKRAFELYTSTKEKTPEIMKEIVEIKNGMNSLRTDYTMLKDYKPVISDY